MQCLPGGGINEFNTALRKNMLQGKAPGTLGRAADPEGGEIFTPFFDVSKLNGP